MGGHVVDITGPAIEDERTGRIKAGKIGADRLAIAVDRAVGNSDPPGKGQHREAEQDQTVAAHSRRRQPFAGAQPLQDMSHFTAEFYEYCATLLRPYRARFNVP